jgi:hypothetical protein
MEGVVQYTTQKIGSILFLLCRTTSKSVVQHKIHNTSVGLSKQTIKLVLNATGIMAHVFVLL